MRESRQNTKKIWRAVTVATALLVSVSLLTACSDLASALTKVENTPEEYERHLQLFDEEALLGQTKSEIFALLGFPDDWKESIRAMEFGGGLEAWDESIHYWRFSSESVSDEDLSMDVFFSDSGLVEEVVIFIVILEDPDGPIKVDSVEIRRQGIYSEYNSETLRLQGY